MPRSRSRFALKDNEIIRRLKAGNGKIAGIKCLVAVDDVALVPVEVKGIDFYRSGEYSGRGIAVKVQPLGGHGTIWVSPANLLDNNEKAIAMFNRKNEAAERVARVRSAKSDRQRRSLLVDMRSEMNKAQRQEFDDQLPERLGDKAKDAVKALNSITSDYEANRVAEMAAKILYNLSEYPEYD